MFSKMQIISLRNPHWPREPVEARLLTHLGSSGADDPHRRPPENVLGDGEEVLGLFEHRGHHRAPHHADVHPGIGGSRQAAAILG